jgi:ABC-type oligopeptide transport system ATPase subunit
VDGVGEEGAAAAAGPKIRVRGLTRRSEARGEEILRGVDLDVPHGVVVGVIGPSGSGKSTLLRALNRLWEPAPGAVLLDGVDICGIDVLALRRKVGMLFQLPAMFDGKYVRPPPSTHTAHTHGDPILEETVHGFHECGTFSKFKCSSLQKDAFPSKINNNLI